MVNQETDKKKVILSMLRNSSKCVSGQDISNRLNVSRVTVWKHIKVLQELGYKIEGSSQGYTLKEESDRLYSWEFESNRYNYQTYRELSSTMDVARDKAVSGCEEYTTIIAETQSAGKGRGDKNWISNEGGLYFTTILRPSLPSSYHYVFTFAATSVLCEIIKENYSIPVKVKWPNDIMIDEYKICGVLSETHMFGDRINWLNLGIGINVNNDPQLKTSSSLKKITGLQYDRKELLTTFEDKYKKLIMENSPEEIRKKWKNDNYSLNKKIHLKTISGQIFKGTAIDLDATGALIIKNNKNELKQALFGDNYIKQ